MQYYSELPIGNYVPRRKGDRQIKQDGIRRVAALKYGRCGGNMEIPCNKQAPHSVKEVIRVKVREISGLSKPRHPDALSGK